MIVPFQPKSIEEYTEQYAKAFDYTFDAEEIQYSGKLDPQESPAHIFDFEEGLRLVLFQGRHSDGSVNRMGLATIELNSTMAKHMDKLLENPQKNSLEVVSYYISSIAIRMASLTSEELMVTCFSFDSDGMIQFLIENDSKEKEEPVFHIGGK